MPTSMTVALGLTIFFVMKRGLPIAVMRMSAWEVRLGRLEEKEWQTVTVAFA